MALQRFGGAEAFLAEVEAELSRDEAANSLLLGRSYHLASMATEPEAPPLLVVHRDGAELLAAFMTPPHPLVLASTPPESVRGVGAIAQLLAEEQQSVPGVTARPHLAEVFAGEWSRRTGSTPVSAMNQRIYRLTSVAKVPTVPGRLRRAGPGDGELVGAWMVAFGEDIGERVDPERVLENARSRIEQGEVYLWEDGGPRSMACRSRPTRRTITVNGVYTPPEVRGRGYATTVVASLSRELLAERYTMCVLYTDLANPTSNRIYQRIGYEPVCDSTHLRFGGF